jgi:thymidine phosphorylase
MSDHALRVRRLGIETRLEAVVYMRQDCEVCRSEGFAAATRVEVRHGERVIVATLNVVTSDLLRAEEVGLSEVACQRLGVGEGDLVTFAHPAPLESLSLVRAKVFGARLTADGTRRIVRDVVAGRYADVHLASLVTACASSGLDRAEMVALTRAMIEAGERLAWSGSPIVDKHSVGGLPGNRTTLIVVPIADGSASAPPTTS